MGGGSVGNGPVSCGSASRDSVTGDAVSGSTVREGAVGSGAVGDGSVGGGSVGGSTVDSGSVGDGAGASCRAVPGPATPIRDPLGVGVGRPADQLGGAVERLGLGTVGADRDRGSVLGRVPGGHEPGFLAERPHARGLRGERDPLPQHLAAEQGLQVLAQRTELPAERVQLLTGLRLGAPPRLRFRLQFELAAGRDLLLQLELVDLLRLRRRLLARRRRPAVLHGHERTDQRRPERGDDREPDPPEVVGEHQREGGADGEEKADGQPRPTCRSAARVVTHASHVHTVPSGDLLETYSVLRAVGSVR